MAYTVVIPARHGSSRLPGKPLLDIGGKPMVQRVWEQACRSTAGEVVVATDDPRIADVATAFGARVCMTSAMHPSGTDRLQEVAMQLALPDEQVVVNVQGDEPLVPPAVIDQVAAGLADCPAAGMATLCEPLAALEDVTNPNIVKVVMDAAGRALYFSRAPIPWPRDAFANGPAALPAQGEWYRHIGIYAYRAGFLHDFVSWAPAPQEQLEQLEQLRAMHNGVTVQVAVACAAVPGGVDTQADLDAVRALVAAGEGP